MLDLPTANQPYYTLQVYESYPDHIATVWYFQVDSQTKAISVQDAIAGDYISLSKWRRVHGIP